ncbi:ArnT family glycosyltransferase [Patescibacteria group bacterium]
MKTIKYVLVIFLFTICVVLFSFLFQNNSFSGYLKFSDAGKFADIARNLVLGRGFTSNFSFFNANALNLDGFASVAIWISPVMPYLIFLSFKLFGISDFAVILVSAINFVFLAAALYFLGNKLIGRLVGALSVIAIIFNLDFLNYASSGAAEPLFSFQIILATYLLIIRNKWSNVVAFTVLILMYFTRPQAIIYVVILIFLYFLLNYPVKKALGYFLVLCFIGSVIFVTTSLQGKQGLYAVTQILPGQSPSDALRGAVYDVNIAMVIKKVFYNIYNFYKALPQVASPYLWGLFAISIFRWKKDKVYNAVKIVSILMVVLVFLTTAVTIPFFRYIHPVVPLVYLFAVDALVWIITKITEDMKKNGFDIDKKRYIYISIIILMMFFVVGNTLGVIFLDSRFKSKTVNIGKHPIYVQLSWRLKEITEENDVIVTNLDTWGSWYGERKTVWYPLEPDMLVSHAGKDNPFDAIYLTSYLMDDENYYMGEEWRKIFEDGSALDGYELESEFKIDSKDTYENTDARAVLLRRVE